MERSISPECKSYIAIHSTSDLAQSPSTGRTSSPLISKAVESSVNSSASSKVHEYTTSEQLDQRGPTILHQLVRKSKCPPQPESVRNNGRLQAVACSATFVIGQQDQPAKEIGNLRLRNAVREQAVAPEHPHCKLGERGGLDVRNLNINR